MLEMFGKMKRKMNERNGQVNLGQEIGLILNLTKKGETGEQGGKSRQKRTRRLDICIVEEMEKQMNEERGIDRQKQESKGQEIGYVTNGTKRETDGQRSGQTDKDKRLNGRLETGKEENTKKGSG